MERRDFLKLTFGLAVAAAGAGTLARDAQAALLSPQTLRVNQPSAQQDAQPAVTRDEVDHLKPEEVHWGHHGYHHHWGHRHWGHHHWGHRHWGWHHHHWGHRHWGWHHHHWHRHHWHRHYW
jgi:hypothetical protein